MKKSVIIFLIGIALNIGIIGLPIYIFWFDYDGNTLFMGRDVLVTFWNDTGYLTRDENKFVFRDVQFADSTFPYLVDYYYIKEINGTEFLYIVCKDNMMVFDKTRICILFLSTGNVESNLLIKYMQRHYGLNELNIVSSIDELDAIDREIYINRPKLK